MHKNLNCNSIFHI